LNTAIILDYQNVNLVGLNLYKSFGSRKDLYIHPLRFSEQLLSKRNLAQKSHSYSAELKKVLVFRGLPSPFYDPSLHARVMSQTARWQKHSIVTISHRSLKYDLKRDSSGKVFVDEAGQNIILGRKEKGIDVLCALALVREAQKFDLVILASQDSDLIPAIDEACSLGRAKIETFSWYSRENRRSRELRPDYHQVWNTRLDQSDYLKCLE